MGVDLNKLYNDLDQSLKPGGRLELFSALGRTVFIADTLTRCIGDNQLLLQKATVDYNQTEARITVEGTEMDFGFGNTRVKIDFTISFDGYCHMKLSLIPLHQDEEWRWEGLPWIAFRLSSLVMMVEDKADGELSGKISTTAKVGSQWVSLTASYPFDDWTNFDADGSITNLSIADLSPFSGGANLLQLLPVSLRTKVFAPEFLGLVLDGNAVRIKTIQAKLRLNELWPLFSELEVKNLQIDILVDNPGQSDNNVTLILNGDVVKQTKTILKLSGTKDNLILTLGSNTLPLDEFLELFVPVKRPNIGLGDVQALNANISFKPELVYSLDAMIDTSMPPQLNKGSIQLRDITVTASGDSRKNKIKLKAQADVYGSKIEVEADYSGWKNQIESGESQWIFIGKIESPEQLKSIVSNLPLKISLPSLDGIRELKFVYKLKDVSEFDEWSITGYTEVWGDSILSTDLHAELILEQKLVGETNPQPELSFCMCGVIHLGGDELKICYDGSGYNLTWNGIKGEFIPDSNDKNTGNVQINLDDWTIGSIVQSAVSWVRGIRFGLAPPWDGLNGLSLGKKLLLEFKIKDGKLFKISFNKNLGRLDFGLGWLSSFGLTYEPKESGDNEINVTLNGDCGHLIELPLTWDAADPSDTPTLPGMGKDLFHLKLLALGQHIGMSRTFEHIEDAIDCVRSFPMLPPIGDSSSETAVFDPKAGWLVATDFDVLKAGSGYMFSLGLIFNDPKLYGLHLALGKGSIFAGLQFEILYQKINESTGVYQAEIQLPDNLRYLEFGAYSITLPNFAIALYTNGDFKLDIGFPWDFDFSRSFAIQTIVPPGIPVIGSAGFYVNKLSGNTSERVPVSDCGRFGPVLEFGFGMRLGIGKEIVKGPLKAGFSVTIIGILEGVLAKWIPLETGNHSGELALSNGFNLEDNYFFHLTGTAGIQGKLFGYVDLSLIKADIDITVTVVTQLTYESYQDIEFAIIADVRVSVKIKIGSGRFAIKIKVHYEESVSEKFVVGVSGKAPWDNCVSGVLPEDNPSSLCPIHGYRLACQPDINCTVGIQSGDAADNVRMNWSNLCDSNHPVKVRLTPVLTANTYFSKESDQRTVPAYVLMLAMDTMDELDKEGDEPQAYSDFETLCRQLFRWLIAAAGHTNLDENHLDEVTVTRSRLCGIKIYLAGGQPENRYAEVPYRSATDRDWTPIPVNEIERFMEKHCNLTIYAGVEEVEPTEGEDIEPPSATFFPMIPQLQITVPDPLDTGRIYIRRRFDDVACVDNKYLADLEQNFRQIAVQVGQEERSDEEYLFRASDRACEYSIAEFVFADYFLLICRQLTEAACKSLDNVKHRLTSNQTLQSIADSYACHRVGGFAIFDLLFANLDVPLEPSLATTFTTISHKVSSDETLDTIFKQYAYVEDWFQTTIPSQMGLLRPEVKIDCILQNGKLDDYTIQFGDTLLSIMTMFGYNEWTIFRERCNVFTSKALEPDALIALPDYIYKVEDGSTLRTVTGKTGLHIVQLAESIKDLDWSAVFAADQVRSLTIGKLDSLKAGVMFEHMRNAHTLRNMSGMVSHFFLHGLRLPVQDIRFPQQRQTSGDGYIGLYQLTGQQFDVPAYDESITFSIDNPDGLTWVTL